MKSIRFTIALLTLLLIPQFALAHCQVPCGIYDDGARINRMREDVVTIGKAVSQIQDLSGKTDAQSANQRVRWITTKEQHASHIIELVSEYFLTQKVKPLAPEDDGYGDYLEKLADHHRVMRAAMKAKQNADSQIVDDLGKAVEHLARHYG